MVAMKQWIESGCEDGPITYKNPDGPLVVKNGQVYTLDGHLYEPVFMTTEQIRIHLESGCED